MMNRSNDISMNKDRDRCTITKRMIVLYGDLEDGRITSLASGADPGVSMPCHSRVTRHIILIQIVHDAFIYFCKSFFVLRKDIWVT